MEKLYKECTDFLKSENWNVRKENEIGEGGCKLCHEYWTNKEGKCINFLKVDKGEWYITMYTNWSKKIENAGKYYGRVYKFENLMYFAYLPIENIK